LLIDAGAHHVHLRDEYLDLEELVAMMVAVGCVALPYSVAAQSAVASLAHTYGARVVGHPAGGLRDQLDIVVPTLDLRDWTAAVSGLPDLRWRGPHIPVPRHPSASVAYQQLLAQLEEDM
jgi:hypothetical protein